MEKLLDLDVYIFAHIVVISKKNLYLSMFKQILIMFGLTRFPMAYTMPTNFKLNQLSWCLQYWIQLFSLENRHQLKYIPWLCQKEQHFCHPIICHFLPIIISHFGFPILSAPLMPVNLLLKRLAKKNVGP